MTQGKKLKNAHTRLEKIRTAMIGPTANWKPQAISFTKKEIIGATGPENWSAFQVRNFLRDQGVLPQPPNSSAISPFRDQIARLKQIIDDTKVPNPDISELQKKLYEEIWMREDAKKMIDDQIPFWNGIRGQAVSFKIPPSGGALKKGSSNREGEKLFLNLALRYLNKDGAKVSTEFSDETEEQFKELQGDWGITKNGEFGGESAKRLIQAILKEAGFYTHSAGVDGALGDGTCAAIQAFMRTRPRFSGFTISGTNRRWSSSVNNATKNEVLTELGKFVQESVVNETISELNALKNVLASYTPDQIRNAVKTTYKSHFNLEEKTLGEYDLDKTPNIKDLLDEKKKLQKDIANLKHAAKKGEIDLKNEIQAIRNGDLNGKGLQAIKNKISQIRNSKLPELEKQALTHELLMAVGISKDDMERTLFNILRSAELQDGADFRNWGEDWFFENYLFSDLEDVTGIKIKKGKGWWGSFLDRFELWKRVMLYDQATLADG
jgi:peptidoglycan hydrolase-like protein with peptidoglycan-binding domain